MQIVIVLIHLFIVLTMIGVVLLQKSEGGGLGIGSTGGFLSSRGTANVLTRTTAALAVIFFTTSLLLSILAGWDRKPRSIIQNTGAPTQQQAPQGEGGGVLDTLRQQEQQQPATPPPGPQVPRSQ
jgi:preprotein translocase subunit SecG